MGEINFVDTTLRDGHQSLWATRMTTGMMLSIADKMDQIGFEAIDLMGMVQFDVCVRYLKEDPWERIRLLKKHIKNTPLQAGIRSRSLIGFDILPEDIINLMVHRLHANGINRLWAFDPLFDFSNIINTLKIADDLNVAHGVALVYSISPVHTDELYVQKTQEIIKQTNIHSVVLKDPSGLLTPERVRTLIPAIKNELKKFKRNVKLEVHTHCSTGLGPLVYLECINNGVDCIHTAIPPLANGTSQPSVLNILSNLQNTNYYSNLNSGLIEEVSEFLFSIANIENKPIGSPQEYNTEHFEHQMPGGMLTNLKFQLEEQGILNKYDKVLDEISQIRKELGWPIMVTPFAQLVVTQAVFNVICEERYQIVPDEVKKYALGHYGKLLAPVDSNVLDRIVENGSELIGHNRKVKEGSVKTLRKKYPNCDDNEILLRYMISDNNVDDMLRNQQPITPYSLTTKGINHLFKEISKKKTFKHIYIKHNSIKISLKN